MQSPRFSCLSDWLTWMETLHPSEIDLGLARVKRVAQGLGLLSFDATIVTVAGTNGKGSFVKSLASLLLADGRSVGTYTSPHINDYNERIQINGQNANDKLFVRPLTC